MGYGRIFKECTRNKTNRQTPSKQTKLDTTFIVHILYYNQQLKIYKMPKTEEPN